MTSREYFEKLKVAATDGTFPSTDAIDGNCVYRTEDGRGCAIGIILSDKLYRQSMEGWDFSHQTPGMRKAIIARVDGATEDFMFAVQKCHDKLAHIWNPEEFIADVRRVFQKFGLEADEPGRAENAGSTLCGQTVS